jgi:hypothetical protein
VQPGCARLPRGSSSRARSRSWPEPFAAPSSRLRMSTDPRTGLRGRFPFARGRPRERNAAADQFTDELFEASLARKTAAQPMVV